jgi:hypothetical protein
VTNVTVREELDRLSSMGVNLLSRNTVVASPANFNEMRFEDKMGSESLTIHPRWKGISLVGPERAC